MADPALGADIGWSVEGAEIGRYANAKHAEDDDFGQPGTLYREVMSDTDREHLVDNIVGHASDEVASRDAGARRRVLERGRPELGDRVAQRARHQHAGRPFHTFPGDGRGARQPGLDGRTRRPAASTRPARACGYGWIHQLCAGLLLVQR